jgi:hypothetical protein
MSLWGYVTSDFVVTDWMQHPPAQVNSIIGGPKAKSNEWYIIPILSMSIAYITHDASITHNPTLSSNVQRSRKRGISCVRVCPEFGALVHWWKKPVPCCVPPHDGTLDN